MGFAREPAASHLICILAAFLVLRFSLSSGGFLSKVQAVICAIIVVQSRRSGKENPSKLRRGSEKLRAVQS